LDNSGFAQAEAICNGWKAAMKYEFDLEVENCFLADCFDLSRLCVDAEYASCTLYECS
jgi:hypothetical protein